MILNDRQNQLTLYPRHYHSDGESDSDWAVAAVPDRLPFFE